MQRFLPIAAFAKRAQLSRRTVERKIASGEIAADYVQRRGRRVFIDAAALARLALDLSRHDATRQRQAATPPDSPPELISTLRESLRRERERADRAEARGGDSGAGAARGAAPPQRSHQEHHPAATPVDPNGRIATAGADDHLHYPAARRVDHTRRSTDAARPPARRFSRWLFWVAH